MLRRRTNGPWLLQARVTSTINPTTRCTGHVVRCGVVNQEVAHTRPNGRCWIRSLHPDAARTRKLTRGRHSRGGGLSWASYYLWDTKQVTQPLQALISSCLNRRENTHVGVTRRVGADRAIDGSSHETQTASAHSRHSTNIQPFLYVLISSRVMDR